MSFKQLLNLRYSKELRTIVERLGITINLANTKVYIKDNQLSFESFKNNPFLDCLLYAWEFFFDSHISKNTYTMSGTTGNGKHGKFSYSVNSKREKNKTFFSFNSSEKSTKSNKNWFLEVVEIAYKCSKDKTLMIILEIYDNEVLNTAKPLYGIAKITEILAHATGGVSSYETKNNLPKNFLKDIRTSVQVERHAITNSPVKISAKECRKRIIKLIFMYINQLNTQITKGEISKLPNKAEKFINLYNNLDSTLQTILLILVSNKGPISKMDFFEEVNAMSGFLKESGDICSISYKFIKSSLKEYIEVRGKHEENITLLRDKFIEEILIYYLKKNDEFIKALIKNAAFLNQLFNIFGNDINLTPTLLKLIKNKVIKDFKVLYGCDTIQFVDESYGTDENDYTNKLFKIASFFKLKENPEILYLLIPEIKKIYLNRIFFSERDYIKLITAVHKFISLDYFELLARYFDYVTTLMESPR